MGGSGGMPRGVRLGQRRCRPVDRGTHSLNWRLRLYLWATRLLYGPLAWAYDAVSWAVSLGRWTSWRRQALDLVAGQRVLELGFGTGDLLAEMARRGLRGVGLEPSAAMQRIAGRKLARRGLRVPRVRAVAQALPFRDAAFDAVVVTFPSEYILDPATWREAYRVLRHPSGMPGAARFVVVGAYVEYRHPLLAGLMRFLFGRPLGQGLARWESMAQAAGFRPLTLEGKGTWVRVPALVAEKVAPGDPSAPGGKGQI